MVNTVKQISNNSNNSPCCFYLGSTDGRVHVWRTTDGEKLTTFTTDAATDCIQCVQFNPKAFMLATASTNMVYLEIKSI